MKCPKCGRSTRVTSTVSPADGGTYRHLNKAGYIAVLEQHGGNWISRQRVCVGKDCRHSFATIEIETPMRGTA